MRVRALSNIDHDNDHYVRDDVFELRDDQGQALVDAGVAVVTDEEANSDQAEEETVPPSRKEQLAKLTRAKLDAVASEAGVEAPGELQNKQAVIDAIVTAESSEGESEGVGEDQQSAEEG